MGKIEVACLFVCLLLKLVYPHRLSIFEHKILRRIYGPMKGGEKWRIRTNQEIYQQCGENVIVKFCKLSGLKLAGHVIWQDDDGLSRRYGFIRTSLMQIV